MHNVQFIGNTLTQMGLLPEEIWPKAIQELGMAAADPWNHQRDPGELQDADSFSRSVFFDDFAGRLTFTIRDDLEMLFVTDVEWLGWLD